MNHDCATEVLICGAGAAGLTLAIDLARRGVAFRLFDQQQQPFQGSRGKGIQPRTLEVFEDLGMVDRMAALGGDYPTQRIHGADGSHQDVAMPEMGATTPAEPYGAPLMLPQFLTEKVMRERLQELGHQVQFNTTLTGLTQDDNGVTAVLAGPDGAINLHTRYLVGTDGGRSTVRHLLGIDFPGKILGVRAMVADVALSGLSSDAWHRFNDGDMARQISLCPLPGTTLVQVQAPVPLEGDIDLSVAGLDAMVSERTGLAGVHVGAVYWASAYSMNARLAERYRLGRVFLAGDAAHIHPPTGGQGLNTSVQDAYNLGWKLGAVLRGSPPSLLDSYELERRPVAADVLGLSTTLLEAAKRGDMRRGRDVLQLDLAYPGSPLSLDSGKRPHRVMAGDRAPDATVVGKAGHPVRLFRLFAGPHWTLLCREPAPGVAQRLRRAGLHVHCFGAEGDLVDTDGHFQAAYGLAPEELVLVRPDGYIAAVVPSSEAGALDDYLRAVGLAA
jgi:2-polyprenyl-6-methoxyphenol hydroxylase-like FAD-dependent oxidoreductase